MRPILYLLTPMLLFSTVLRAQWTWVHGDKTVTVNGVYGTLGVPDISNKPGSRTSSFGARDASGGLWLMGGYGYPASGAIGYLNDLWRYEPSTNRWTWMKGGNIRNLNGVYGTKGVGSSLNAPGARRDADCWYLDGAIWLFGGEGYPAVNAQGLLNDLWRYDIASNTWTWMHGSINRNQSGIYGTKGVPDAANTPGARSGAVRWIDHSGRFWVLGGYGYDAYGSIGYLSDLWRFEISTGMWTWMAGSDTRNQNGVYGSKGVPDVANNPGARRESIYWTDTNGDLWLRGGYGYPIGGTSGYLNDLWKYDTQNGMWTWMGGSTIRDVNGVYGYKGVASATHIPGAREESISMVDGTGRFWLLGGYGYSSGGAQGYLNDLWKYDPMTDLSTWVNGSSTRNNYGVYGAIGVPDLLNNPGSRTGAMGWYDGNGKLWLFGGNGYAESSTGELNDLWYVELNCLRNFFRDYDQDGFGDIRTGIMACTAPAGYVADSSDCNDSTAIVNPGATETCDGVDNNCNGSVDEGLPILDWYPDDDGDGHGRGVTPLRTCSNTPGYATNNDDCDDTNPNTYPGAAEICDGRDNDCDGSVDEGVAATYYFDNDGDGYGDIMQSIQACSPPVGYVTDSTDCFDTDPDIHPGAMEKCDQKDNDCNGLIDDIVEQGLYFRDLDGDGFGNPEENMLSCGPMEGYVDNDLDCDDNDAAAKPGAMEVCDGKDNNCDGQVDEGVSPTWYRDSDGDGFGDAASGVMACIAPPEYVSNGNDCDDSNPAIHGGMPELCDGLDNDCNGLVDDGLERMWYKDEDGDGFGFGDHPFFITCFDTPGYVNNNDDCDDNEKDIYPGAPEICDGYDNDCDGQVDEGVIMTFYRDADGDNYGDALVQVNACAPPFGYVPNGLDCNDSSAAVNPSAPEICDGVDNNCDGLFEAGAPTIVDILPADQSLIVTFLPPSVTGGAAISNYEYQVDGISWLPISPADNQSPVTITGLINGKSYAVRLRAVNGEPTCYASSPVNARAGVDPIWTGAVSTAWADPRNWSTMGVPGPGDDIMIPAGLVNYPVLDMARTVGTLTWASGTSITLNGQTLTVNENLIGGGVFRGSPLSGLVFNGTADSVRFDQGSAANRSLGQLTFNSANSGRLLTPLDIYGYLQLNGASLDLAGNNLTLKSLPGGTAYVGDLTGSILSNATNVTVERYIPQTLGGTGLGRRWRVLTAPVLNTTINRAWQNNSVWNGSTALNQTTGTLITGNRQGTAATANANGYDFWSAIASAGASICWYRQGTAQGTWTTLTGTNAANAFNDNQGYLIYIRGPRSSTYSTGTGSAPTTFSVNGTLKQGTFDIPILPNTGFTLVGNPYPSPLDFDKVYANPGNSAVIKRQFWVWDAALGDGGNYKLIKYLNGRYVEMPSETPTNLTLIQSGQGFFVEALTTAGGTLRILESNKSITAPTPLNVLLSAGGTPMVRIRLLGSGAGEGAADEIVSVMDDRYTLSISDGDDAMRPVATQGYLSFLRDGQRLVMDARPLPTASDTVGVLLCGPISTGQALTVDAQGLAAKGVTVFVLDRVTGRAIPVAEGAAPLRLEAEAIGAEDVPSDRYRLVVSRTGTAASMTHEPITSSSLLVFPNPVVSDRFTALMAPAEEGRYQLSFLSADGKLLMQREVDYAGTPQSIVITTAGVVRGGTAYLRLSRNGVVLATRSLVVQ